MFTGTKTTSFVLHGAVTGGEFRVTALGDECSPQGMYTIKGVMHELIGSS